MQGQPDKCRTLTKLHVNQPANLHTIINRKKTHRFQTTDNKEGFHMIIAAFSCIVLRFSLMVKRRRIIFLCMETNFEVDERSHDRHLENFSYFGRCNQQALF